MINVIVPATELSEQCDNLPSICNLKEGCINLLYYPLIKARKIFSDTLNEHISFKNDANIITQDTICIGYLGRLIEDGRVSIEEVDVYLILEDEIKRCKFDHNGVMTGDWPYGILDAIGDIE